MAIEEREVEVTNSEDWFNEYDKPKADQSEMLPIFEMKLKEGQLARTEKITFLSDGKEMVTRFGATIVFTIRHDNQDKTWFIKKTQYGLLNPIAKVRKTMSLQGRDAEVQRVGQGQKETKWSLTFK